MEQMTAEKLALKYRGAIQAHERFKEALDDLGDIKKLMMPNVSVDPVLAEKNLRTLRTYRNSAIKMFELSLDTLWKYVKEFLWAIHGVDHASPKDVMRACLSQTWLTAQEVGLALDMVDDRNRAAHAYKEAFVSDVCERMPQYIALMTKLLEKTKVS